MQSARNKNYRSLPIIFIVLILLQFALIIFADNHFIPLITSICLLIAFMLLCRFWINFAIPKENDIKNFSQLAAVLLSLVTGRETILSIKEGKSQQDYFLLKRTPAIKAVFVHQDSAALAQQSDGSLRLLAPGFNPIHKAEKVILTFDQRMQNFIYGPLDGESPFDHKRSGESYTDFHARQLRAEKVRSQTKDGVLLFPSFRIFYQLVNTSDQNRGDKWFPLQLAGEYLHEKGFKGSALDPINDLLGCDITACWIEQVSRVPYADIFSADGQKLSGIMEHINRQFSKSTLTAAQKKAQDYPTTSWSLPHIAIYLYDLVIHNTVQKTGPEKDE